MNIFSMAVLTWTLCMIADLQIEHQYNQYDTT